MIEVNLIEKKKVSKLPVVLGVDLNNLNFKMLILAFIVYYAPDFYLTDQWQQEKAAKQAEVTALNKQLRDLITELKKFKEVKNELLAYEEKIRQLKERSQQVDRILKEKTNPKSLLESIARNMPNDLWLEKLEISSEKQVRLEGFAMTYKSIGSFIGAVNDTPFFGRSLNLAASNTVGEKYSPIQKRVEYFEIKGEVQSFNPFGK